MKRVAIQGVAGCFHDIAARQFFRGEEVEVIPCETFKDLFATIRKDNSILGAVAIENTIAGSLLPNHNMPITGARVEFTFRTLQIIPNGVHQDICILGRDFSGAVIHNGFLFVGRILSQRDQITAEHHIIRFHSNTHAKRFQRGSSRVIRGGIVS